MASCTGTVTNFNPGSGYGFIKVGDEECFFHKDDTAGVCPVIGCEVECKKQEGKTGKKSVVTDVKVITWKGEPQYLGKIKSFQGKTGYGFITSDAFPGKDIFCAAKECPAGEAPWKGNRCRFAVKETDQGPNAIKVYILGAAGRQAAEKVHMKNMMEGMGGGMGGMGAMGMNPMMMMNPMMNPMMMNPMMMMAPMMMGMGMAQGMNKDVKKPFLKRG
eukprot:gnl/MRDRNA2_/MRDRNA2_89872_c0_seq1.p1 gnl/MRDRNA2_/MRDRNA2_89872_c0~~gnl/MRDRNA2_/MRDRNA2_89872_c0_seq1.p1  ORF type:complete len:217 (+),score=52.31 gnl/MRDRNA2_/MRDRNA2_89872_c0_seq1:85-735(+)